MNLRTTLAVAFCFILACVVFPPSARANEWNQVTKMEFNEAIEIPGTVLPAGTYWFALLNSRTNRNIVRIYSSDWSRIYATVITVPTKRRQATNRTEIELAEQPNSQAEALVAWYCPGLLTGHEFLYPKKEEKELMLDAKDNVLVRLLPVASNTATSGE